MLHNTENLNVWKILFQWQIRNIPVLPSSWAQCTVRTNKPKCQSFGAENNLSQGHARRGGSYSKPLKSPEVWEVFIGKIWDEGCRVCDFFSDWLVITGQCSRNLALRVQWPTWVGGLSCQWRAQRYSLGRNQDPAPSRLHYCFLTLHLLFLHLLLWLATVLICPFKLRKGQVGWMESVSYE